MLQVFAWDPGLSTGLCVFETDPDTGELDCLQRQLTFRQVGDLLQMWSASGTIKSWGQVVCESFTITQQTARNSQAPWSLEVIGLIRYWAMVNHLEIIFQQPSAVKKLITNDVIKRAGYWVPGQDHAMDATRHAIHHLITKKGEMKECLMPPSTLMSQETE